MGENNKTELGVECVEHGPVCWNPWTKDSEIKPGKR